MFGIARSVEEGIVAEECDLVLFTICGAGARGLAGLATFEAQRGWVCSIASIRQRKSHKATYWRRCRNAAGFC